MHALTVGCLEVGKNFSGSTKFFRSWMGVRVSGDALRYLDMYVHTQPTCKYTCLARRMHAYDRLYNIIWSVVGILGERYRPPCNPSKP